MKRAAKQVPLAIAALVLTSFGAAASQAAIVWGTPTTIANDPTQVSTSGTLVYAYNFGGSSNPNSNPETVNTVDFAFHGFSADASPVNIGTDITITGSGTWGGGSTLFLDGGVAGNYGDIIEGGIFVINTLTHTVSLNNLVNGQDYQVQLWAHDGREGTAGINGRSQTLDGSVVMFINVPGATAVGQFVTGTFTASGTSQTFTVAGSAVSQFNALQVRDVTVTEVIPAPTALPAGLATLGLFAARRSRRRNA